MRRTLSIALVLVSAILLFWRLDGVPIWRDEATTAVWGRLMAETGAWMPYVYHDGQLLVQADDGHDANSKLLPAMQSYGQFYVSALGFKLLGVSDWSARAPYALIGAGCLFALWRLGVALFGPGLFALVLPALTVSSIFFLNAVRQVRYYGIVVLAAVLIFIELLKYFRDPDLAGRKAFYLKLGAYGLLMYFSNYVSFVGMWGAVGLFILIEGDRRFLKGFIALSAGMAVIVLTDFAILHSEFAGNWPPVEEAPLADVYQSALVNRGRDVWRALPLILLVPAAFWLALSQVRNSGLLRVLAGIGTAVVVLPAFLFSYSDAAAASSAVFWIGAALCLAIPAGAWLVWRAIPERGVWARTAALAFLILLLSPAVAIAAGKTKALTRHFYQILPAGMVLCTLTAAGVQRRKGSTAAGALLVGMALWPNLDWAMGGTEQVVQRQFTRDDSYNGPLMKFLGENLKPGDNVAFVRNVKGMAMYFYFPEMHWVELLNSDAPYNERFRDKVPADQFDDCRCADWYVIWDPRGATPKGLNEAEFEQVWTYSYPTMLSFWDRDQDPSVRTYEVFRRKQQR